MTVDAPCDHCGLSLGAWPFLRDVDGEPHCFCCYGCFIGWQVGHGGGDEATAVELLIRLGVGAFLAMNIMLFSLVIYSGGIVASDPVIRGAFHYGLWLFATPVMVMLGGPFIVEALSDLARGRLSGSTLISIGAVAAYGYSVVVTVGGGDKVYFDTATMVLGLFTLGRFLEANGRARAVRNLAPMLHPRSMEVTVISGPEPVARRLADVRPGDLVRVLPGDYISVDGVIAEGSGFVDRSWLTGESQSVGKKMGDAVLAGTINIDGAMTIRCTSGGLETRWAAICQSLLEALSCPTSIQSVTDRVAAWFVPGVLVVALGTLWYWSATVPFAQALVYGLAVLIVACPCALGLAAPLATAVGLDRLAGAGCLMRSGDALYRLAGVQRVAIDKTGTLTQGSFRVAEIISDKANPEEVLTRVGALEQHSRHPLARGIADALAVRGMAAGQARSIRAYPGRGIAGRVGHDDVATGSARWFCELGWRIAPGLAEGLAREEKTGRTAVYAGWNGSVRAVITFDDVIRADTRASVAALKNMGIELCVVSGDAPGPTAAIAEQAGIESWRAPLTPEEKADFISSWQGAQGSVAMIGDGINDGLALQMAEVGIAVGDGIDLARETADAVLPDVGLSCLPPLIVLARRTKRQVLINLAWAFGYNVVAIGLAAAGLLQPVIAAALMAGSSFVVIANSLRSAPASLVRPSGTRQRIRSGPMRNTAGAIPMIAAARSIDD